jgi:acetylcholinesterase
MESGSAGTLPLFTPDHNQDVWDAFVAAVPGCESTAGSDDTFDCLRSANASDILDASVNAAGASSDPWVWVPLLDGQLITGLPSKLQQEGRFARLPFITGTNLDEGKKRVKFRRIILSCIP